MQPDFIFDDGAGANTTILLAHGAGAPMDSAAMTTMAEALASAGFRVVRFEFDYMAARRAGARKPPPKAEILIPEYRRTVEALDFKGPLIIGGKSLGGRVASMVADDLFAEKRIIGLLCLGYPFHPPDKPAQLRTKHLADLKTPTLIVQGTRDLFGRRDEVINYNLSASIKIHWLEDGDHDFRPRKSVSGLTLADHLNELSEATKSWVNTISK